MKFERNESGKFIVKGNPAAPNPSGLCACGCSNRTPLATKTRYDIGHVKGQPTLYIRGHWSNTAEARQGYDNRKLNLPSPNPSGLCLCGCGNPTSIAKSTSQSRNQVKGQPLKYLSGHGKSPRGKDSHKWKGGRYQHKSGYIYIYKPEHPKANADGYVLEHRLVLESNIGRYLSDDEVGHHINHVRNDNRPENLALMSKIDHSRHHQSERTAAMQSPTVKAKLSESGKKGAASRWGKRL